MGLSNQPGAQVPVTSNTALLSSNTQCHFDYFKSTVSPVLNVCLSCHGGAGSGSLKLSSDSSDNALAGNMTALLPFIESTATDPSQTTLLQKVTPGGQYPTHYKLSNPDDNLKVYNFASNVLTNPTCATADPSASPSTSDSGGTEL